MDIVQHDPAVQHVVGFTGQGSGGAVGRPTRARLRFIETAVAARGHRCGDVGLRANWRWCGARLFLIPIQDISVGDAKQRGVSVHAARRRHDGAV